MIGYQYLLLIQTSPVLALCCSPVFTGGGYTWKPHIVDPGLWQVTLFSGDKLQGASSYSYGEIVIDNKKNVDDPAGPMDYIKDYNFYGKEVAMYIGLASGTWPDDFSLVYTAATENIFIGEDTFSITLRGRQAALDEPLAGGKFLGNNSLPDGVEGTEDLKDKFKPILIGRAFNFAPVCCNTSKLIYAVSPLTGIATTELNADMHVYDKGVELFCAGVQSNIETYEPPPGQFYIDPQHGYIRLGSSPAGAITCSGVHYGFGLKSHPANLITAVLTLEGKSDWIDATSFEAYKNFDMYERGLFLTGEPDISRIIDELLAPFGYWYFNAEGKMVLGFVRDPSNMTPVYTADAATNITSYTSRKITDTKGGIPAKSITLQYSRNYTPQDTEELAGSVTDADKSRLSKEWLESAVTASSPDVLAEEMVIPTSLNSAPDEYLTLLETLFMANGRELVEIEILKTTFLTASTVKPGDCIHLNFASDRFGYTDKHFIVVRVTLNYVTETVQFTLWG